MAVGRRHRSTDLQRVLLHHAAPPLRSLMPRGNKQWQEASWDLDGRDSARWEYWAGGWSPRAQQAPWKASKGKGKAKPLFQGFEDVSIPTAKAGPSKPAPVIHIDDGEGRLVTAVQEALNAARKAEQKVSKLKAQAATVITKWQVYEEQMKKKFQQERLQCQQLQEKLARELQEAEAAQAAARRMVRQTIAADGQAEEAGDAPMALEPTADQVFAAWAQEDDQQLSGVLDRAFGGCGGIAKTPPRARPVFPLSPTGAMTADSMAGYLPGLTSDPYLVSPSAAYLGKGPLLAATANTASGHFSAHPGIEANTVATAGLGGAPGLVPMEAPTAAPQAATVPAQEPANSGFYGPSPTFGDRAERRRALEPFGLPGGRSAARSSQDALATGDFPPQGSGAMDGRTVNFVADDGDEQGTAPNIP